MRRAEGRGEGERERERERERACGNVGGVSLASGHRGPGRRRKPCVGTELVAALRARAGRGSFRNRPAVDPSACQCACVCPVSALLSVEVANQLVAARFCTSLCVCGSGTLYIFFLRVLCVSYVMCRVRSRLKSQKAQIADARCQKTVKPEKGEPKAAFPFLRGRGEERHAEEHLAAW